MIAFIFAGAISGLLIAFSLDMKSPKELFQGALGGVITGILMALMLVK